MVPRANELLSSGRRKDPVDDLHIMSQIYPTGKLIRRIGTVTDLHRDLPIGITIDPFRAEVIVIDPVQRIRYAVDRDRERRTPCHDGLQSS